MALLNVLIYPDERLKTVATPMTKEDFTPELDEFIDNMFETMYEEQGIGLAATQVDFHKRLIVIDIEGDKQNQLVLINPEIIESEGETGIEEGCLSLPGFNGFVPRKEKVKIRALNRKGEEFELEADELLAICIQHEMDHLEGIVFADYLSPLKRNRIKEKLTKLQKQISRHQK
ncbi:peptide deformylase [Actinobacillus delphinicola]|uniref:Peptide deformylase n=1 Tax=Actinobacillus delphinicola TaxID=51161 RepID=A0A448TU09_9PAST|nr:peptide deformylase [Actinobacillus delphinicola]MDG6897602.1 peptide deformylase [Actinobacillus delphinicola]VEJ09482.1 peptide deformylase [Actinobacillus delphinicola]